MNTCRVTKDDDKATIIAKGFSRCRPLMYTTLAVCTGFCTGFALLHSKLAAAEAKAALAVAKADRNADRIEALHNKMDMAIQLLRRSR